MYGEGNWKPCDNKPCATPWTRQWHRPCPRWPRCRKRCGGGNVHDLFELELQRAVSLDRASVGRISQNNYVHLAKGDFGLVQAFALVLWQETHWSVHLWLLTIGRFASAWLQWTLQYMKDGDAMAAQKNPSAGCGPKHRRARRQGESPLKRRA
jgi:hypothetical protein